MSYMTPMEQTELAINLAELQDRKLTEHGRKIREDMNFLAYAPSMPKHLFKTLADHSIKAYDTARKNSHEGRKARQCHQRIRRKNENVLTENSPSVLQILPYAMYLEKELAAFFRVSPKTVEAWRYAGTGPEWERVGRGIRYRGESILAFIEKEAQGKKR